MNIVFLIHQEGSLGYSMKRYTESLANKLSKKGYQTQIWAPKLILSKNSKNKGFGKWLRYIDQYLLFPFSFKWKNINTDKNTIYVLIDQALGIWTPLIKNKKHVVHCHDFIALKSAQGLIPENPTAWTGKIYQYLILNGFRKASNFISISKNTQKELGGFLNKKPIINAQIYNAIDEKFKIGSINAARITIGEQINRDVSKGYILHIGSNTFYKNRNGVLNIYNQWRKLSEKETPLIMIGSAPTTAMLRLREESPYSEDIHFLTRVEDTILIQAYQGATVFIFPSLLEGFGFPIIEAMACGCPVITTDKAPMNEIGGEAATYITSTSKKTIVNKGALAIETVLNYSKETREELIKKSLLNAKKYQDETFINDIENIYLEIMAN